MGAEGPCPDPADSAEIEREWVRGEGRLSAGQVVFDVLFGMVTPVVLLVGDAGVFRPTGGEGPAVPAYCAGLGHVAAGCLIAALALWLVTGARRRGLGALLSGPFAAGALLSLGLAGKLLEFAYLHVGSLRGLVAFTPWLTAFVFARQALRAVRAGAEISPGMAGLALVVSAGVLLLVLWIAVGAADRRAQQLEDLLFSRHADDQDYAITRIRRTRAVDFDRVALLYAVAGAAPAGAREKIAALYAQCTGEEIEGAFRRLRGVPAGPAEPKGPKAREETPEERTARLLDALFSRDPREHEDAAKQLFVMQDVDYQPVVRRYRGLPDGDPVKARIREAFPGLAATQIDLAVKELEEREKRARPPAEAPKAPEPAPPGPD